jgi:PIN domain nuclease of toxin-antitoxin system
LTGRRLLLDTHVALWWLSDTDNRLSDQVRTLVDTETEVYLSAVSVWEVAIKHATGKTGWPDEVPDAVAACDLNPLPVIGAHGLLAAQLPAIHRDPFDRILIAQATIEGLTLVTSDEKIRAYPGVDLLEPQRS